MYGEDSSGRKVSLLNDDTSTSSRTTTLLPFTRPTLSDRSRFSNSASSVTSSRSRDSQPSSSSRPSSISCSPRRSPPTPPLVRLDSQSSIGTQSPMTPPFPYDPMDQRNLYKNGQNPPHGFYLNAYAPSSAGVGPRATNSYGPMPDATHQPFYPMSAQQPLPPVYDLNGSFAQQATLNPLQTASLPQYVTNPALNPLSSPITSSVLPATATVKASGPPADASVSSTTSTTQPPFTASAISPIKTDASSTPPTSSKSGSKASNNSANQPKKKYPCPHAKQANCKDTFTTSGHAARHGKKHTGEKNVACPTCGKTFTRKDNMKQHERTHKNQAAAAASAGGRGAVDGMNSSPILTSDSMARRSRAASSSTVGSANSMKEFDIGDIAMMGVETDAQLRRPEMKRSKLSEIIEQVKQDGEMDAEGEMDADADGESPALDALATIAAGEIVQ